MDIIIIKNADKETIRKLLLNNKTPTTKEEETLTEETIEPEEPITEDIIHTNPELFRATHISTGKPNKKRFYPYKGQAWTKEEDNIIKEEYNKPNKKKTGKWKRIKKILPHRTKASIQARASTLKVTSTNTTTITTKKAKKWEKCVPQQKRKYWTKEEDNIIKEIYPSTGKIDWKQILNLLPNRSKGTISVRASTLKITNKHRTGLKKRERYTLTQDKRRKWTKKEINTLKKIYSQNNKKIDWEEISKALPNRSKMTIFRHACDLELTNRHRKRNYKQQKKDKQISTKKRKAPTGYIKGLTIFEAYRKFVKERTANYGKAGYDEQTARRLSIADWHKQKHPQTPYNQPTTKTQTTNQKAVNIIENFPNFETINKDFMPILETMLKHLIANKTKMSYLNTKDYLDVSSGRQWHEFVTEIMLKSNQIAEYFNVPNHFRHLRTSEGFDLISYEP